ncbi:MAG: hypothetical protein GHCLOJNM_01167 [bacterium]|nr:hypothetical protein [bacterium]
MNKHLIVLTVLALAAFTPVSHSATITVPGGQPTIQAAILAAANGDTIEIANGTYTEDIFIPGSTLLSRNNLTLQPATGATVVIEAANAVPSGPATRGLLGLVYTILGAGGAPDHHGLIVEGSGTTLRNLTIRNNSTTGDAVVQEAATVFVFGDNLTIDNCIIEANPDNNAGRAVYVFTGFYAFLDALTGGAVTAAGYAAPRTSANLTITGSTLKYGDAVFDTVDAAYYIAILNGLVPPPFAVVHGSGTITNTEVVGYFGDGGLGELDAGNFVWNNCRFHDANDAFDIGGGTWVFNDCVFERSTNNNLVAVESNLAEAGPTPLADVSFNDTIFCGDANDGRLVRVSEGDVSFARCIFNVTETAAVVQGIQYSPGDFDGDWAFFGFPPSSSTTVDHCDFFSPDGRGILGDDPPVAPEPVANLTVTNSIFYTTTGIALTGADAGVARNANIHDNDIFAITQIDNSGAWTLTSANNLNVDPQYNGPGSCDANAYLYFNNLLGTADETGGALGSQGPLESTAVDNWSLY